MLSCIPSTALLHVGDKRKVEALLALYKKVYRGMGVAVIAASFAALPFLHELVNTEITVEVYEIYGLFVLSTAVTYFFFMYRAALLQANQEKYLVSCSDLAYAVVSSAGQVFLLPCSRRLYCCPGRACLFSNRQKLF